MARAVVFACCMAVAATTTTAQLDVEVDKVPEPPLELGPVDGLTTTWRSAPGFSWVPLGLTLVFRQPAPPQATVVWVGALETARDLEASYAVCPVDVVGLQPVVVKVEIPPSGGVLAAPSQWTNRCDLLGVALGVEEIVIGPPELVPQRPLQEGLSNEESMAAYFGESVAQVKSLGDATFLTSVERTVSLRVDIRPAGVAPLVEWRAGETAWEWGPTASVAFADVGRHVIEVGPVSAPVQAEVETYAVSIESVYPVGEIHDGEPVTFVAVTDPPGFEQEITWITSTKYGVASPGVFHGPTVTALYHDFHGPEGAWMGAKADNAAMDLEGASARCQYTASVISGCGLFEDCVLKVEGQMFCGIPCSDPADCEQITRSYACASDGGCCTITFVPVANPCVINCGFQGIPPGNCIP